MNVADTIDSQMEYYNLLFLRITKLNSFIASVRLGLKWPSFKVIVLIRKLCYLAKFLSQEVTSTHTRLFHSLAADDALNMLQKMLFSTS